MTGGQGMGGQGMGGQMGGMGGGVQTSSNVLKPLHLVHALLVCLVCCLFVLHPNCLVTVTARLQALHSARPLSTVP